MTGEKRRVRTIEHLLIPLQDGTMLAAKIWLPDDAERQPVPAILEYLPYRKRDGTAERDALTHPWFAAHGYAAVRVDVRGSGESDGVLSDEYSRHELNDGLEVIAWLAAQKWCSGAVGMMGISWGGFNALQIAALRPPALKAIITLCSTDDRYRDDVHYAGGAKLNAGFGWAGFFFSDMCRPPDPLLVDPEGKGRWRSMWRERLEKLPLFLERWLRHQRRDDYWRYGSVCEDFSAIRCPVFAVGGWTDGYTNAIPRLLERLKVPRLGLIGPWAHAYPHFAQPGPQIGFLQEALRWWDHWLKGKASGIMDEPMLRAWMCDSVKPADWQETLPGRWVGEAAWPSPHIKVRRLPLSDRGLGEDATGLTPRPIRSPLKVGSEAGQWCPFGRAHDQAGDQRADDRRSLCFDSAPLGQDLELLGAPEVELELTCDRPVAILTARLCDLRPAGESLRLSFGVLNLAHRESHAAPSALVPGEPYRIRLKLNDCGARIPAGHRLRLALSTSYWPMVWPAPQQATVTILGGSLDLPVRPVRAEPEIHFEPAITAPPEKTSRPRPGTVRLDRIGLETTYEGRYRFDLADDDPTSAVAEMHKSETLVRGDWKVRIESSMRMSGTRDAFHVTASIRAFDGDAEFCARQWDEEIARELL